MKKLLFMFVCSFLILCNTKISYAECYDNYYSIHGAIEYSQRFYDKYNPEFPDYSEGNGDCTNFVSQCISVGGGIPEEGEFRRNGGKKGCHPWTVPEDLFGYLTEKKRYDYDEIYTYVSGDSINISYSEGIYFNVGDIVFWNYDNYKDIDHAVIIVGFKDGVPCYAAHSNSYKNEPLYFKHVDDGRRSIKYYIVHMTNADGLIDVTDQFVDRKISLYSKKTNSTVCVDGCTMFNVVAGKYGEVGFMTDDGRYLSVDVGENDISSPAFIRVKELNSWESFRIFKGNNNYYIQSMANGKWLQIDEDGVFRAAGRAASTWEELNIY